MITTPKSLVVSLAVCALAGGVTDTSASPQPTKERAVELPSLTVTARRGMGPSHRQLGTQALEQGRANELADAVSEMPGISCVRRGGSGGEPVIRGQGWERVAVQVGCLPLYGACPARMDPPLVYVDRNSPDALSIALGLPSVTLGPGGTAGRIVVSPHYIRGESDGDGTESELGVRGDTARDGYAGHAITTGGKGRLSAKATADFHRNSDYESANGITVPSSSEEYGASLSLGFQPTLQSRLWTTLQHRHGEDIDYPALPMDTRETEATIVSVLHQTTFDRGGLERIELEAGYAAVDHLMDNRDKSNRSKMLASTRSDSESFSARAAGSWRVATQGTLEIGLDGSHAERDAMRTRTMVPSGAILRDHIWPCPKQEIAGLFGELQVAPHDRWTFRVGARLDAAESEASAMDDTVRITPGSTPTTVRDSFVAFYGPDAADDTESELLLSGNAIALWRATDGISLYTSLGRVTRTANLTERYFAYAPAPGGYQVGNPTLDPEAKHELTAGLRYVGDHIELALSGFAAQVDDDIYPTLLERRDVNGDEIPDRIRGFQNVNATFFGGEAEGLAKLGSGISVPFSVAYVRGRNTTDDRDLPEIPPLDLRVAFRLDGTVKERACWSEFGMRYAAEQTRVDETFPEDETSDFSVFHLRAGVKLAAHIDLNLGVENLFDNDYHEHLTREALLPIGDLARGAEIPEPCRYLYASLRTAF